MMMMQPQWVIKGNCSFLYNTNAMPVFGVGGNLHEHIRRAARNPFSCGKLDCWLWVSDWVLARTGNDPAEKFRGKFDTRLGAAKVLKEAGLNDWGEAAVICAKTIGLTEIAPDDAVTGDVGMTTNLPTGDVIGLIRTGFYWTAKIGPGIWSGKPVVTKAWSLR